MYILQTVQTAVVRDSKYYSNILIIILQYLSK